MAKKDKKSAVTSFPKAPAKPDASLPSMVLEREVVILRPLKQKKAP